MFLVLSKTYHCSYIRHQGNQLYNHRTQIHLFPDKKHLGRMKENSQETLIKYLKQLQ